MQKGQQLFSSYLVTCILNAFLCYTTIMLNIVTIQAIRKTSSLSKNLKTLLLSLAVSDLGVGLVVQPLNIVHLVIEMGQNNENNPAYNTTNTAFVIPTNLFIFTSFFGVMALIVDRFLAIHLHLRYQELLTHKRVVGVVISVWVLSTVFSLAWLWIPKNITYILFVIGSTVSFITATFFSVKIYLAVRRHTNHIQALHANLETQNGQMQGARKRKFAIAAVYVYLVFFVCYLPNICVLHAIAFTSTISIVTKSLRLYTLTLVFLNSSLNPLIYCWKMRHVRHSIMNMLRNAFSSHI